MSQFVLNNIGIYLFLVQVLPYPRSGKRGCVSRFAGADSRREDTAVGVARRLAPTHPPATAARDQLPLAAAIFK